MFLADTTVFLNQRLKMTGTELLVRFIPGSIPLITFVIFSRFDFMSYYEFDSQEILTPII
jgi:hypothetical protein